MKKKSIISTCILVMFVCFISTAQTTVYVSEAGAGTMDGTSEANAYGNFATAMADIDSEGDRLVIIGTVPTIGQNLTLKSFAFTIEGLDASSTITGDGGTGRLFTINGATSADVTFKNLTFLNNSTTLAGGAVLFNNNAGAKVTFDNCNFTGNTVANAAGGGALFFANGELNIIDSSFENNTSIDEAGAINGVSGTITITNTLFKSNSAATKGGAIYSSNANFTITGSTFYDNATTNTSGQTGGAAFYVAGVNSTNSITNCTFFENTIALPNNQDYGAIRTDNGNTTVTNSLFYDNKTNNGDGAPSDWGSGPNGTQTFNTSIAQWISTNVDNQDEGAGSITGLKGGGGTPANLASSNLTFNATSGYVEYNNVEEGTDSPIDFGSDGNDVGAWDSGFTLSTDAPSDTTAPVITILGDNPATVELGGVYTDAGATADGGETVTVSGTVDTSTVGAYTLTYSATDAANNTGTATRTVNVVAPSDTTAPVITILGENPTTVELGATYTDAGATADGGETVTTSGTIDTSMVGAYTLTYSATDAANNTGTATRIVNVYDPSDTTAPVITILGDNPATVELGGVYTDAGATADGGETVTASGTVDTSTVGAYTLTYSATDAANNTGTATRTVNVVAPSDTTAPVITILGDNPFTIEVGATYTDAGATADGGETVTTSGTIDTSTVGAYTLTYSATDAANNTGTATRKVNVVVPSNTIQNTIYVSSTGAGNIDGTSEANAYDNFATAMANIESEGDRLVIIGTVSTIGQNLTLKSFAFTIEGLDASSTITGDGGTGRLFTINGATSADVTFKNLTLSGNNTTLAGGAVLFSNDAGAKVTFDNCNFTGNTVANAAGGGALYFANGELNVIDSSFENNTSIDEAGAINGVSGTITITNTLFKSNSAATKGGAIYSSNANFTITGSTFYDNATTNTSGQTGGAAFYVAGVNSTNSITNCTFFENTIGLPNNQDYGAIRTDNGNTTVTNSLFYDNKTNNGDGAPSDWGSAPNGTQTFNTSIAQWISTNVDNQDEGAGSITGLKGGGGTPADLASSNLTFNATSGYVEYTLPAAGDDSPIYFGSDGELLNVNNVGAWNFAPVITILGDNPAAVELGGVYTDAGAIADGGETVTTSGTVDTSTVGAYTLTYTAINAANNRGTATRIVNVADSRAPLITILGDNPTIVELGGIYTEAGATADGGETVTISGTVDTSTVGVYTLTYSATNDINNTGTAIRIVNVVDTIAPVVTVLGDNPATVERGATYTDAGATADGGETVTIPGSVDTSTVGTYTLSYSATDAANNTGTATRILNIVDTTAPVITVLGDNPAFVELGASYSEAGANVDGGEKISISGTVDTSTAGAYTLTYSATDTANNTGTAIRTVNVVDTTPVITAYMTNDSKIIEITHDLDQSLSVKLFNILGSCVLDVKNVSKTARFNVNQLKAGVYILIGESSGKYFTKKLFVN